MIQPNLNDFRTLCKQGNLIPVYREILADRLTPVSAYENLTHGEKDTRSFLLESVEGGERVGRYSVIGINPSLVIRSRGSKVTLDRGSQSETFELSDGEDILTHIRAYLKRYSYVPHPGLPRFCGGAVGFFSYDIVRFFEKLPDTKPDPLLCEDACFYFTDTLVIFDHVKHRILALCNANIDEDPDSAYMEALNKIDSICTKLKSQYPVPPPHIPTANALPLKIHNQTDRKDYETSVDRCKEYIKAGDVFQIVLSQRFQVPFTAPTFDLYRALRTVNPSPYMFYLNMGERKLIGSSPEILVTVTGDRVRLRPIAGSSPRGADAEEDIQLEKELLANEKERAEHIMLVDLGRNDVGRVSDYGTVKVNELMVVERYSHIMHIVSDVTGRLASGRDCFDVFRASFPAGTVSGAPKVRAMEIIEELEPVRRGFYAGAIGYFGYNGDMDMAITIRTMLTDHNVAYLQSGGGLVYDSDPAKEYQESINKAGALVAAIELAERGLD